MKVFEILKYFLTEKMDDLTKQLFNDVQKEENQRMYGIWILLLWNRVHFFSFLAFLSPAVNVSCSHHLWICQCSWTLMLVLKYFMYNWGKAHACLCFSHVQEMILYAWDCSCFCSFLCFHVFFWELKGNPDHNGFFGNILRIQSGLGEQLMAIPVKIPVKWILKDRIERFSLKESGVCKGHLAESIGEKFLSPLVFHLQY